MTNTAQMLPQKTAVIYARYSSDNQREESIEGQLRECKAYAEKNGYKVLTTYIDRALTGKSANRPEFLKMVEDGKKHLFDFIIVYKLDRFSRSRFDNVQYKSTLEKHGVKVLSVHEQIEDTPEGRFFGHIMEDYAQYYSEELAVKVSRGLHENALKCVHNGGQIPFGYRVDEERHYYPDPVTAPIVGEIFEKYANGMTKKQLVDELSTKGIKGKNSGKLSINTISNTLKNRKYLGEYRYGKIVTPNAFEPITTQEIFDKVQKRLEKNKHAPARFKAGEDLYILTGKLFCGECGAQMVADGGTSKTGKVYKYYNCHNNKQKKTCKKGTVPKKWLEDIVVDETIKFLHNDIIVRRIVNTLYGMQSEDNTTLPMLENQLKQTQKALDNMIKAIEQGILTETTKSRLEELERTKADTEIAILQEQIVKPRFEKSIFKRGLIS